MKALLIWPKFDSFSFWNFEKVCDVVGVKYMTPPLGLLTVGALLPTQWNIRLVDENIRMLTDNDLEWADQVLVGSKIVHRQRALDVIAMAKRAGKIVAVGGPDPTLSHAVYERSDADFVCVGEGELTIPMLVEAIEQGTSRGVFRSVGQCDLTQTPPPRFDLINFDDYLYVGM